MSNPRIELGFPQPQCGVLTTILIRHGGQPREREDMKMLTDWCHVCFHATVNDKTMQRACRGGPLLLRLIYCYYVRSSYYS